MCALCTLMWSGAAEADLASQAQLLEQRWRAEGAEVKRLATLFLFEGDVHAQKLSLPAGRRGHCVRLTVLSDRKVQFAALASDAKKMSAAALQQAGTTSAAGTLSIDDCGDGALEEQRVLIAMTSSRGSLELLVSRHDGKLAPLDEVLPERAAGARGEPPRQTAPPPLAPVKQRIARARQVARNDGASKVVPLGLRADALGAGVVNLKVVEGCHRLHLFADGSARGARGQAVDIDAEVRSEKMGGLIGRDRSHAVDARLDFCVGKSGPVELRYAGAAGARNVTLIDALWPAPKGLPRWGTQWRAGALTALSRRNAPPLDDVAVGHALGPAGVTWVPIEVEPNSCYLAVAAMMRGDATAMRLTARYAEEVRYDDAVDGPLGAAVSFCSGAQRRVSLKVDVRGRAASWAMSLWNMTAVGR